MAKRKSPLESLDHVRQQDHLKHAEMEIDVLKDDLTKEELLMKLLLNDWKNLDGRFIPDDEKDLYKETFERYLMIQARREVEAANQQQSVDVTTLQLSQQGTKPSQEPPQKVKSGKKRGRKTPQESIQLVGEMLVNSGHIVPISTMFQKLNKYFS